MEALTGATVAALTLYDMGKSADKAMTIGPISLAQKTGGKSGDFRRDQTGEPRSADDVQAHSDPS